MKWKKEKELRNGVFHRCDNVIKHSYAYQFGKSKRRKQWPIFRTKEAPGLKECRKRDNGWKNKKKTVSRAKTKWVFEAKLMVKVKTIEDPQTHLQVGEGRLPD